MFGRVFLSIMNLMRTLQRPLTFLLALCLLAPTWISAQAQGPDFQYFNETGHNVQGEFLQFYLKASNPTLVYGYPLTEQFTNSDGLLVQYFQRARFEYHPELPEGQRVQLTPLGQEMYTPSIQLNFTSPFACRYFSETGYSVCFSFWEFFENNGGVDQFGYPISPFEYQDNMLVQYFQKARLEWQPWNPEDQHVVITDLGRMYFDKVGEDPGLLAVAQPLNSTTEQAVLSLQVLAFVQKAVALPTDQQTIFIVAQDQGGQPVSNAECTATVYWPNGLKDSSVVLTNESGVAVMALSFNNQPQGKLIYTDITCNYSGLTGTTTTSFRIWY